MEMNSDRPTTGLSGPASPAAQPERWQKGRNPAREEEVGMAPDAPDKIVKAADVFRDLVDTIVRRYFVLLPSSCDSRRPGSAMANPVGAKGRWGDEAIGSPIAGRSPMSWSPWPFSPAAIMFAMVVAEDGPRIRSGCGAE